MMDRKGCSGFLPRACFLFFRVVASARSPPLQDGHSSRQYGRLLPHLKKLRCFCLYWRKSDSIFRSIDATSAGRSMAATRAEAFLSSDPERALGINRGKAEASQKFISKQIAAKLGGAGATQEYKFILDKLRSKKKTDAPLTPTIYLGLARNASAISGDRQNRLVCFAFAHCVGCFTAVLPVRMSVRVHSWSRTYTLSIPFVCWVCCRMYFWCATVGSLRRHLRLRLGWLGNVDVTAVLLLPPSQLGVCQQLLLVAGFPGADWLLHARRRCGSRRCGWTRDQFSFFVCTGRGGGRKR